METNIYEIKSRRPRLQSLTGLIFLVCFFFQETRAFIEEDNPLEKIL